MNTLVIQGLRQSGKSTALLTYGMWMLYAGKNILIVAPNERAVAVLNERLTSFSNPSMIHHHTRRTLDIVNGGRATFLSAKNRGIVGLSMDAVLIDDSEQVDEEVINQVLRPMLATSNGHLVLVKER